MTVPHQDKKYARAQAHAHAIETGNPGPSHSALRLIIGRACEAGNYTPPGCLASAPWAGRARWAFAMPNPYLARGV